jgi:hypothetical protein
LFRLRIPRSRDQWILLLLGVAATVAGGVPLLQGINSLRWSKADGVITYSAHKAQYRRSALDIRYRYMAGGRSYDGDRYRFRFLFLPAQMRGRDVQVIVGRYPAGERVQVAVNPGNPSDSVLVPGPDSGTIIPLLLGFLLLVFGLGDVRKDGAIHKLDYLPEPVRPRYRLAITLAVIAVGLLLLGGVSIYQGISSETWPTVEGRIFYSHARSGRNAETLLWYEYYVENQRHLAQNYRNGGNGTPFRSVAEDAAKRYPEGLKVTVYYNPSNPDEALLEPGVWWGNLVAPAIGLIVLGVAWLAKKYAEAVAWRRARRS